MAKRKLSRRGFLRTAALATTGTLAAACAPKTVEVEREVTTIVEKEVTKIVEKEVTKIVEKAVEVEPTLIRVHIRLGGECDHWSLLAQQFNDRNFPDIHAKMECFPGAEYFQKTQTMAAGGTLGDVIWESSTEGFPAMAGGGAYAPLDELVAEHGYDLGQIYPAVIKMATINGKLYGLPQVAHPGGFAGLFYNKHMFDEAGVGYPDDTWTYDDLVAAAVKLTDADKRTWGFLGHAAFQNLFIWTRAWGGDLLNAEGTKCLLGLPESVAALEALSDVYHKHKVSPLPGQMDQGTYQMFAANRLAMYNSGFWGATVESYAAPDAWGVAPFIMGPAGVRGTFLAMGPTCVSAISEHKEEAFLFAVDTASYDAGILNFKMNNRMAARPDVMQSEEVKKDPTMQVFTALMDVAMPLHLPANYRAREYWQAFTALFDLVWLGEKTVDEVIDDAVKEAQAVLDRPPL